MLTLWYHRTCDGPSIVPNGPGYPPVIGPNQICTLRGARPGNPLVIGEDYISAAFTYSKAHVWRNFGIEVSYILLRIMINLMKQMRERERDKNRSSCGSYLS